MGLERTAGKRSSRNVRGLPEKKRAMMPALVRPTWAASRRWETSKGAVAPTLAEPQGGSREAKLKEAEGKATTVGTRTGSEAGRGGELANDSETRRPSKARQVEPDGAG